MTNKNTTELRSISGLILGVSLGVSLGVNTLLIYQNARLQEQYQRAIDIGQRATDRFEEALDLLKKQEPNQVNEDYQRLI